MSTFVLIHGAWHGAWQWERVVPLLQAHGHRAVALDLPGRGADTTPLDRIRLADYADAVSRVVLAHDEPVVLVGHSLGGLTCSLVAERHPERVQRLIYVAAMLFPAGMTVLDMIAGDPAAEIGSCMDIHVEAGWSEITVGPNSRSALYADCTDHDAAYAEQRLLREPLGPLSDPMVVTHERFGRVPRSYVACRHDRAITFDYQTQMVGALPCEPLVILDSGHCPFVSMPSTLSETILDIASSPPSTASSVP